MSMSCNVMPHGASSVSTTVIVPASVSASEALIKSPLARLSPSSSTSTSSGPPTSAHTPLNTSPSSGNSHDSIAIRYPIATSLLSGACAGAIAKTVIAPLDRTKINFQIRNVPYSLRKAFGFLGESYRKDGITSWWRGNTATMARVIPYAALNYTAHEQWKKFLKVETPADRKEKPLISFCAGSLAGVTASSLTYPLDLARARMAVSRCELYKNLGEVFLKIWRNEGPAALYRGIVPTLLGVIPYGGASFYTYEFLKRRQIEKLDNQSDKIHPGHRLVCGAVAGLIGQSCSYPFDIVRRRMQTSRLTGKNYRTVRGTMLHIIKHEGVTRGLYKGLSMNWIKGPIAVGISFMVYDTINHLLSSHYV